MRYTCRTGPAPFHAFGSRLPRLARCHYRPTRYPQVCSFSPPLTSSVQVATNIQQFSKERYDHPTTLSVKLVGLNQHSAPYGHCALVRAAPTVHFFLANQAAARQLDDTSQLGSPLPLFTFPALRFCAWAYTGVAAISKVATTIFMFIFQITEDDCAVADHQ